MIFAVSPDREPPAIRRAFPCWFCNGKTRPAQAVSLRADGSVARKRLATRICDICEVTELRLKETYFPQARVRGLATPDGDPYIDHAVTYLPSPG